MKIKDQKLILLVEDNSTTTFIETAFLEKYGFNVISASTGEAAIMLVEKSPDIDLILMDINLDEEMDGTEAARSILKMRDIPLIFLSAHDEPEIVEKTESITSYGYVVKNTGEAVLIASIKMAFRLFDSRMKEKEYQIFRNRIFESSTLPIVVMDKTDFRFIDCNPAAAAAYGYATIDETLGKTPLDVSAPLQYDGTSSREKTNYYISQAVEKGSIVFEWRHQRPNGVKWDAEVHLMHFLSDNKDYFQFTLIDITNQKQAYNELENKIQAYFGEKNPVKIDKKYKR